MRLSQPNRVFAAEDARRRPPENSSWVTQHSSAWCDCRELHHRSTSVLVCVWLIAGVALWGCGDDENDPPNPSANGDSGPKFAVLTELQGFGASPTRLINVVDTLDQGEVDPRLGIELGGFSRLWGLPKTGAAYSTDETNGTITKWVLNSEDQLENAGVVSLAGIGVGGLAFAFMAFDDASRGFFFDNLSGLGAEIDLDVMEIVAPVDASALLDDSIPTFFGEGSFVRRGNTLVGFTNATDRVQEEVSFVSKVFTFDLDTNEFAVEDAPCGGLVNSIVLPDGELVMTTNPWVAAIHELDPTRAPEPCLARWPADAPSPSPTTVALNSLGGGLPTGGIIPAGGSRALVRVLNTANTPIAPDATGLTLAFLLPIWETWSLDFSTDSVATPLERLGLAGGIRVFVTEDGVYENESSANFESTILVRTDAPDGLDPGLSVPGVPFGVVQLR